MGTFEIIADLDCYLHQSSCFGFKVEISVGLVFKFLACLTLWVCLHPRSLGSAFVILIVGKPESSYVLVI